MDALPRAAAALRGGSTARGSVDALHLWLRSRPFLYRVVWITRVLLAGSFLPLGLVKLLGRRFTMEATPVGAFFEALYQTGMYWQFLGAAQVAAGLLLLIPATAHLGALLFLPIMANILAITLSLEFRAGTSIVTGLMFCSAVALVIWDFDRFRGIFTQSSHALRPQHPTFRMDSIERAAFWLSAVAVIAAFSAKPGLVPRDWELPAVVVAALAALAALARFRWTTARV